MIKKTYIYLLVGILLSLNVFAVQYYNLSLYESGDNIIDFYIITDVLLKGFFSLFMVMAVGVISTIVLIKYDHEPLKAIHLGSLYSLLFGIILLIGGMVSDYSQYSGRYVFIPALVYSVTLALIWFKKY